MALITKLDACNRMLIASGLTPVTNLDAEGSADSRIAEVLLDDAVLDAQLQGLAVSSYPKVFTPDASTGDILLPDYIQVELYEPIYTDDALDTRLIQIAQRDGRLFNVSEQSFDWSRFDEVKLVVEEALTFEQLPVQTQRDIIATASLRQQLQTSGDPNVSRMLAQEQQFFRAQSRANDVARRHGSIFSANTPARSAVRREGNGNGMSNRYPKF